MLKADCWRNLTLFNDNGRNKRLVRNLTESQKYLTDDSCGPFAGFEQAERVQDRQRLRGYP